MKDPGAVAVRFEPTREVLDNGLVVVHQENAASPAVSLRLSVAAGSAFEAPGEVGLAGFTATMTKRGTSGRSKAEIGEVLDFTGADLVAGAARHTAWLRARCRTADLDEIMELMGECAMSPSFPAAEVEKRRGDILTGLREDADDPARRAAERFRELAYPADHPYSWRVAGTEESIEAIDRDRLVAHHDRHFAADRALLVIVGGVGAEEALASARRVFAGWSGGSGGGFVSALPEIDDAAGPDEIVRDVVAMPAKMQVDIALGHPSIRRSEPGYHAAAVMNMVLGRFAMGGRLGRSVREEQGMAYYTYSLLGATIGPGPFLVRAGVAPDNVDRAIDSIVEEIERMRAEPVGEEELEDAKSALIRSVPRSLETNGGIASALQQIELHELGLDYLERYPGLVEEVTVEAVQEAARRHLRPDRHAVAIAGPLAADDGKEGSADGS